MKIGDLVRWSPAEKAFFMAYGWSGPLSSVYKRRMRGIILDDNKTNFFVLWEDGTFLAQKPETLEVISEA